MHMQSASSRLIHNRAAWLLLIGLLLRLFVLITSDATQPHLYGGDAIWFIVYGYGFFTYEEFGDYLGYPFTTSNIPTPPLYLMIVGGLIHLMPVQYQAIMLLWGVQLLASMAICYFAYRIAQDVTQDEGASLLVLGVHCFSLPLITDVPIVMTETLYLFFIYAGLWLYVRFVATRESVWWLAVVMVGVAFGLATLTRAVSLMFPVGLFLHAIITKQGATWRRSVQIGAVLMLVYAGVVGTWTAYNWFSFGRFVIASDQFMPAVWRGTVDLGISPTESDALLGDSTPQDEVIATLSTDIGGYLQQRARQLWDAISEPYSVAYIGGDVSMRQLVRAWLASPADLGALWTLISTPYFWVQLYIYILHYGALLAMPMGLWLLRARWRVTTVLLGFIAYTLILHFVTLAIPRYIFPTYSALWILSALVYVRLWARMRQSTATITHTDAQSP